MNWVRSEAGVSGFIKMKREPPGGTEAFYRKVIEAGACEPVPARTAARHGTARELYLIKFTGTICVRSNWSDIGS